MDKIIFRTLFSFILGTVILLDSNHTVKAQGARHVVQLSGVVLGEDSVSVLPGVNIYVPKAGRGTTSNRVGYFSMPVLVGDELVVSSVGYKRQYFKVPDIDRDNLTIVIEMVTDTTFLETVEIMPFPTEEIFKEAVLALNLPIEEHAYDNMNEQLLALMLQTMPMDGAANSRYYLDNWAYYQNDRFGPRPNPLLNPFNWAKFFRSLRSNKK